MQEVIIRAVCWTLLHSLWQGLALAVAAGILMLLSKKSASALRYNLLVGLLVFFVCTVCYTFYLQINISSSITGNTALAGNINASGNQLQQPVSDIPAGNEAFQKSITSFVAYFNNHASLVVLVWFIIFLVRFVKIISGLAYVQRIRHYGTSPVEGEWQERLEDLQRRLQISQPVLLLESALLKVPVVLGWLKPVILIPAGMLTRLSAAQVESILLHELAHIRRRDYLVNILQHIADTVFFYNPAVAWVSSTIRCERENCCDDIAIRETRSRKQFVEALVSFHSYSTSNREYALSFAEGKNQLLKRVQRIVEKKNHSLQAAERTVLACILLVTGAAFITVNSQHTIIERKRTPAATPVSVVTAVNTGLITVNKTAVKKTHVVVPDQHSKKDPLVIVPAPSIIIKDTLPDLSAVTGNSELDRFRQQLQALGYKQPGDDVQLQQYLNHGVSATYISKFIKAGYNAVPLDKYMQMIDHGVTIEYIRELKAIGYNNIDTDKAIQLMDHGVNAGFIAEFMKLGFKNISLDEAVKLHDHGVHGAYIEAIKKKTGSLLTLEEYIKLQDGGFRFS